MSDNNPKVSMFRHVEHDAIELKDLEVESLRNKTMT